jgi:hypothetical protein
MSSHNDICAVYHAASESVSAELFVFNAASKYTSAQTKVLQSLNLDSDISKPTVGPFHPFRL